jgi:molybdopterin converting factor subunit 1
MRVRVLYFGVLKEVLGLEREEVDVAEDCSVAELLRLIADRSRSLPGVWTSLAVAVNQEYVSASALLHDGDEVALLPPVSGGAGKSNAYAH